MSDEPDAMDTTGAHPIDKFAWRLMNWRRAFENQQSENLALRTKLADAEKRIRELEARK